jgi:HSP20 family protein
MNELLVQENSGQESNGNSVAEQRSQSSVWFTPRFDVCENENEYVLMGDLPGVAADGLEITFEDQELSIWGQAPQRYPKARFFAGEYGIGDFRRTFNIGEAIDADAISAELKDGVLTVHLPKRPEAKPRKIGVRGA